MDQAPLSDLLGPSSIKCPSTGVSTWQSSRGSGAEPSLVSRDAQATRSARTRVIHARSPFAYDHLERWLQLFHDTVELGWVGPNATRALTVAHNVAEVHSKHLLGAARDEPGAGNGARGSGGNR